LSKINKDNLRKTIYYLKKNGWKDTFLAARERLQKKEQDAYVYEAPSDEMLQKQRQRVWESPVVFSIIVPVYHTPEKYFCEMVESVLQQTYPYFELILADAGEDEHLKSVADKYTDARIRYCKLSGNGGIAENTNQGILLATGDYIALFDHDDLLTADALYEMALEMEHRRSAGEPEVMLVYTDEDKCDGEGTSFYDPHFKMDYDPDLLLTNNYICHFTAVKASVVKELLLRREYDGAQDFDFVLRVTERCEPENILHIPKVLYHWRCHIGSTAANPASKRYAYEAGKRAVEDAIKRRGWDAEVSHLKHLGFYRVVYKKNIFEVRPEVGAVGGRILNKKGRLAGGMMDEEGNVIFEGLRDGFSGYVNLAALTQQALAVDVRCMRINPACRELAKTILGDACDITEDGTLEWHDLRKTQRQQSQGEHGMLQNADKQQKELQDMDWQRCSLTLSRALREAGYVLIWDPQWCKARKDFYV